MVLHLHDLTRLNEGLAAEIDALVPRLFANARREGNYWAMGAIDGSPGSSLKIWRSGPKQGEWSDFSAGTGGRPLQLVIASPFAGGGDAGAGIRWAARFLGQDADEAPAARAAREAYAARQRQAREAAAAADQAAKRRSAKALFLAGTPIAGTLAEAYLRARAIDLRALPRQPGALRFHPALLCPESGVMRPGLIAAVSGADGFLTVHRTFLRGDGLAKAAMSDPKRSYSAFHGGCIALWRGDSGRALKDMPDGEWLAASEGVEDGLSIALAEPALRVVAAVALGNLGRMFVPKQCGGVYWHRHRGDAPEAERAYAVQCEQLERRGIALREVWAPGAAKDFNEWLMGEAARGAQQGSVAR